MSADTTARPPLSGRCALVTGASRGIGAAIALALAESGAAVAVHFHRAERQARAVADACRRRGPEAVVLQADLTSAAAAAELVKRAAAALGPPAILVNNAGTAHAGLLLDADEETLDRLLAIHVKAPFFCSRAALPQMMRQGGGRIINIASVWGQSGGACETAYSAAKGAVIAFTRALAKEVGTTGVTVNAVAPGAIDTGMLADLDAAGRARLRAEIPLGRIGEPADVAGLVAFLAGPGAAYITGQVIGANGGWHM